MDALGRAISKWRATAQDVAFEAVASGVNQACGLKISNFIGRRFHDQIDRAEIDWAAYEMTRAEVSWTPRTRTAVARYVGAVVAGRRLDFLKKFKPLPLRPEIGTADGIAAYQDHDHDAHVTSRLLDSLPDSDCRIFYALVGLEGFSAADAELAMGYSSPDAGRKELRRKMMSWRANRK